MRCPFQFPLLPPRKKIYSFVGEIKRETMSKNCKPMERHMLGGTGRESFWRQMEIWMDSEGLEKIWKGKSILYVQIL